MWRTLSVCNGQALAALVLSLVPIHPSTWKEAFSEVRAATTTALLWRSFALCVILHTWRAKKGGDHSSE
jgi:hypothetical protein